jgi:predicted ATP-grasp superfamily ATP-dependent carboligase
MALVLDKSVTQRYAREVGIDIPKSFEIASLSDLDARIPDLQFPVVSKWKNPLLVAPALARAGLALDKVRYSHDATELRAYLARFAEVGAFPVVQEYCPGYGLGQFLFMHRGEALLAFQHRRIHEWPPEGGFSTLCEGLANDDYADLLAKSIELLRRIGWEGPAMVEYRLDPERDEARLMEVNGRFWGSLPLAYYSGAEFAWLTYAVLGEEAADTRCSPRGGVRCRNVVTDTKRLLRILFAPRRIQDRTLKFSKWSELRSYVAEFFNTRTRYFVFCWDDPKPFFADVFFSLLGRLKRR